MNLTCLVLLVLAVSCLASSHTFLLEGIPADTPSLEFSFSHPLMDHNYLEVSTLSGVYDLTARFSLGSDLDATVSLPYATSSIDGVGTESILGNITVGIGSTRSHWEEKEWSGSITMSIPTMPDMDDENSNAIFVGLYTDYYRNTGKFLPKTLTVEAIYSSVDRLGDSIILSGFEIGPALLIPVEDFNERGGSEVLLEYGSMFCLDFTSFNISLEVAGLLNITSGFAENVDHAVVLGGHWTDSTIQPGIFGLVNLGSGIDRFVDAVVGLEVTATL